MTKYVVCFLTERRVRETCEYFMEVEAESIEDAIDLARSWEGDITEFRTIDEDVLNEEWIEDNPADVTELKE